MTFVGECNLPETWDGAQRLLSYSVCKNWGAQMYPMSKRPCHCTFMGLDGSMELEMVWIDPAVVEIQCPQRLGCPTACPKVPDGQMILPLHICRPRQFHRTWNGANWPIWKDRWMDGWKDRRRLLHSPCFPSEGQGTKVKSTLYSLHLPANVEWSIKDIYQ